MLAKIFFLGAQILKKTQTFRANPARLSAGKSCKNLKSLTCWLNRGYKKVHSQKCYLG